VVKYYQTHNLIASGKSGWRITMNEVTMAKIQQLPEPLAQEVNDFIDFLLMKHDRTRWQLWTHFTEAVEVTESDFADYLPNLEDYEDRLARGEIQW
jgi:hypothetical protein